MAIVIAAMELAIHISQNATTAQNGTDKDAAKTTPRKITKYFRHRHRCEKILHAAFDLFLWRIDAWNQS
ncbi:hypothetical protein P0F65_22290 [Sphingomonas sp. I4]